MRSPAKGSPNRSIQPEASKHGGRLPDREFSARVRRAAFQPHPLIPGGQPARYAIVQPRPTNPEHPRMAKIRVGLAGCGFVSELHMHAYKRVLEEMQETRAAIENTGRLFMYAEDWIYAPAVTKTAEVVKATKDKILFMKGEESHSGSHAAHAAHWAMTGGGALIRMGCHPLSAVLYLKQVEAKARGEAIGVASVCCDVGNVTACLRPEERTVLKANPVDVEDWGTLTVTFSDGTKATVLSGDMIVGGVRNLIETYTSGGALFANITPNTHMMSYQTSEEKLANVSITDKADRKTGWQYVCLEEEWTRGYLQEIQDFMECVATGRQPLSGLSLAYETTRVNYAGYWAAEEGRRVTL